MSDSTPETSTDAPQPEPTAQLPETLAPDSEATPQPPQGLRARLPLHIHVSSEHMFSIGFLATLGVLTALLVGEMVANSFLVITYITAGLFFALGLEPLVRLLQRMHLPRGLAILTVFLAFVGAIVGVVFAITPAIASETEEAMNSMPVIVNQIASQEWFQTLNQQFDGSFNQMLDRAQEFAKDPQNLMQVAGGLLSVSASIFSFFGGAGIIIVLTLYFMASLRGLKHGLISLLPASKRRRSAQIIDRVFDNVGGYVISQAIISLTNATCAYIAMSFLDIRFREVLALLAFLCSLLPLIGSSLAAITVSTATVLTQIIADPDHINLWPALFILIYYIVYIQLEAYVLIPRIVNRAVPIPGIFVVIAVLLGGTLLGVFGALLSIPVAASVIFLVQELWVPRQNQR